MATRSKTEKHLSGETYFSRNYRESRSRFLEAAATVGAEINSYPIDAESTDELSIDVAILGAKHDANIVISSGVHGVEGFFGSAIQLALLDQLNRGQSQQGVRYVLIHALNPYGFSCLRRCNENNVDLNRNFLPSGEGYVGAPDGYADLNDILNPESPPPRFEPFTLKAVWNIWKRGVQPLKETVATGQYEYPRGLFFGGRGPSQSARIVMERCDSWLGSAPMTMHIDFHSGLGRFGTYKLLLTALNSTDYAWYTEAFGTDVVEPLPQTKGTAYRITGQFGEWMQRHFTASNYRFVNAEFGTYGLIRMLKALRAENRAHHYDQEGSPRQEWSKRELLECFCPRAPSWRRNAVVSGTEIIERASRALAGQLNVKV